MNLYYKGGKDIPGLQVLKFLAALAIIHLHATNLFGVQWNIAWRMAVPCFFMISGYFMLNDLGRFELKRIKRPLVKMAKLTLWASVIYIAIKGVLDFMVQKTIPGYSYHFLDPIASPIFWRRLLIFGDAAEGHLWYLMAYLQMLILLWVAVRFKAVRILWILAATALPAMLLLEIHYEMGPQEIRIWLLRPYIVLRNCVTVALPFFMIGVLIRRYEHRLRRLFSSTWSLSILPIIVVVLTLGEYMILEHLHVNSRYSVDILFTTAITSTCMFLLFLLLPTERISPRIVNPLAKLGRKHSLTIYLVHPMLINIIAASGLLAVLSFPKIPQGYYALIAIVLSLLCSWMWRKTQKAIPYPEKVVIL